RPSADSIACALPLAPVARGPLAAGGAAAAVAAGASAGASGFGGAGGPAAAAAALAAAAATGTAVASQAPPIWPISVPTRTVVPSGTRMLDRVPSAGEGISTLILSVWISTRGSSLRTLSPTALSHLATVPSATLSPSCGTTIEIAITSSLVP